MASSTPAPHQGFLSTPKEELVCALVAGALLGVGVGATLLAPEGSTARLVGAVLVWLALAIGLFFGGRAAWGSLRQGKFDIDVLMFVGAAMAATPWVGAPGEGALLLFLFTLSGALEDLALARTTRAVEALSALMPTSAQRWENGSWASVAPEALAPGDRVRILPGELIPTDATLTLGATSVNQASLTGESQPRDVQVGDELFAGTINVGNPVEARVSRAAAQSSLQKIVDLVTRAQQQREPVQRFIDKVSQPYAIGVTLASITVFFVWWLVAGFTPGASAYTAITLLIVASPCALIIATPTATLAGISRGARMGVLFKGGQSIERLARLRSVAFDKTGTLTLGRPRVLEVHPVAWSSERDLLSVSAGLEAFSTHPIAGAIIDAARDRGVEVHQASDVTYVPGRGVSGVVDDQPARLGSLAHTAELIPVCLRARVREVLDGVQSRGQIAVVCAWNDQAAVIILADAMRPGAEGLTPSLHALGVRPVVMLTGDNAQTASRVASTLGLDAFYAELLPQDKVDHVQRLKGDRGAGGNARGAGVSAGVGVIGDGVNDAPALAAADVSIAIGSIGSDAALESADIVLLTDDLMAVPRAVALARRTRRTIRFNIVFALGAMATMACVTLIASLAAHWQMPLWIGVIGHEGGTLLVVANSLLLLAFRAPANAVRTRESIAAAGGDGPAGRGEAGSSGGTEPVAALSARGS
jgi:Cd2+/Zn2+-exporting ATPase